MNVGLYQAAAALNANSRWQESIAQNLVASSIPGFKKQELSFGTIAAGFMPAEAAGAQRFSLPQAALATNFSPGEPRFTGAKIDEALQGGGFFAVQMTEESATKDIYQDMVTNQLAESISKSGTFGLAKSLRGELTRQLSPKPSKEGTIEN